MLKALAAAAAAAAFIKRRARLPTFSPPTTPANSTPALSAPVIGDGCNYRAVLIYSNHPDPNLLFPPRPPRLDSSPRRLPPRKRRPRCLYFFFFFFNQASTQAVPSRVGGKRPVKLCRRLSEGGRFQAKERPNTNIGRAFNSNVAQCASRLDSGEGRKKKKKKKKANLN